MAASTTLSVTLSRLLEELVTGGPDRKPLTPMAIYATVLRARDEAVCLEARAADRDTKVNALLADLQKINAEITAHRAGIEHAPASGVDAGPVYRTVFGKRMAQ